MSRDRTDKILKIADHFSDRIPGGNFLLYMDIKFVDEIYNLDLDSMLEDLDSLHVVHDVFGIYNYLDRKTKQLTRGWIPRFGRPGESV